VNNETSFFREMQVFEYLKSNVLPEILKRNESKKCFSLWCAAASTGQEPYSLMMLINEYFPSLLSWKFRFLATDISSIAISAAREATYREHEIQRGLPVEFRGRYFSLNGKIWSIKNEIKRYIEFKELNLINDFSIIGKFDLILIRNMFIYLSESSRVDILNRIRNCLNPEGYVVTGASEIFPERITFLKQQDARFPVYRCTGN
jgi:chemotaxis protein methyltransferase CheR